MIHQALSCLSLGRYTRSILGLMVNGKYEI